MFDKNLSSVSTYSHDVARSALTGASRSGDATSLAPRSVSPIPFRPSPTYSLKSNLHPVNQEYRRGGSKLHQQVLLGNAEAVSQLLHDGADPLLPLLPADLNGAKDFGKTALHLAAERGDTLCVRTLLGMPRAREVLNHIDRNGQTALHLAAKGGHTDTVRALLKCTNTSSNMPDGQGQTALHLAVRNGHKDTLMLLLDQPGIARNPQDRMGQTPLHWAVFEGQAEMTEILAAREGTDVNAEDFFTRTPLMIAASNGDTASVQSLLNSGRADVNAVDNYNLTPLFHAVRKDRHAVVATLLLHDGIEANCRNADNETPLHYAARAGSGDILTILLGSLKVDFNVVDRRGYTPLHAAVQAGKTAAVHQLLAAGFQANVPNDIGKTPIHLAAHAGMEEIVHALLSAPDIDLLVRDNANRSVLHDAVEGGNLEVIRQIVHRYPALVNAADGNHATPLHDAIRHCNPLVLSLLLHIPIANVNQADHEGNTPLHYAAQLGNANLVSMLLQRPEINLTTRNTAQRSAADCARFAGHWSIANLIDEVWRLRQPGPSAGPSGTKRPAAEPAEGDGMAAKRARLDLGTKLDLAEWKQAIQQLLANGTPRRHLENLRDCWNWQHLHGTGEAWGRIRTAFEDIIDFNPDQFDRVNAGRLRAALSDVLGAADVNAGPALLATVEQEAATRRAAAQTAQAQPFFQPPPMQPTGPASTNLTETEALRQCAAVEAHITDLCNGGFSDVEFRTVLRNYLSRKPYIGLNATTVKTREQLLIILSELESRRDLCGIAVTSDQLSPGKLLRSLQMLQKRNGQLAHFKVQMAGSFDSRKFLRDDVRRLARLDRLTDLTLLHGKMEGGDYEVLSSLPMLHRLRVSGNSISHQCLEQIKKMSALKELFLDSNCIHTNAESLLAQMNGLSLLSLRNSHINEQNKAALKAALPNTTVIF